LKGECFKIERNQEEISEAIQSIQLLQKAIAEGEPKTRIFNSILPEGTEQEPLQQLIQQIQQAANQIQDSSEQAQQAIQQALQIINKSQ
jgi:hypothetical protein